MTTPTSSKTAPGRIIPSGAEHTIKLAGNLSDNEVFSCPRISSMGFSHSQVLGRGVVNRKATSTTNFVCSNPVPPICLNSQKAGFQSQLGAKAMTATTTGTNAQTTTTTAAFDDHRCAAFSSLAQAMGYLLQDEGFDLQKAIEHTTKALADLSAMTQGGAHE